MSKYIEADVLKKQVESPYTEYPIMIQIRKTLKDFIDDAPSIDIIRCKDCIYYEALGYDAPKDGWCNTPKLYCDGYWVDEDDFCSDAKRED